MRESPLPAFAGEAGLLDGRVVVAIAKSMVLRGLRPEVDLRKSRSQCDAWLRLFSPYDPRWTATGMVSRSAAAGPAVADEPSAAFRNSTGRLRMSP